MHEKFNFNYNTEEADYDTVTQVYTNIVGGAVMAMGLKYAGTGDQMVKETIINELTKLKAMKVVSVEFINDLAYKNCL